MVKNMIKRITRKMYRGMSFLGLTLLVVILGTACSGQPPANATMTADASIPNTGATIVVSTSTPSQPDINPPVGYLQYAATVPPASINTVIVTEGSFFIQLDHNVVAPGRVTFTVTNQGPDEHEFLIFQTKLAQNNLPVQGDQIVEDDPSVNKVEDHAQVAAGTTYQVSLVLVPGHYVVVCNLPGHYLMGMHADLFVSEGAAPTLTAEAIGTVATPTPQGVLSPTPTQTNTPSSGPVATLNAMVQQSSISLSNNSAPAGLVQLNIQNQTDGQENMVLIKTDMAPDQLPVQNAQVNLNASGIQKIAELMNVQPTQSVQIQQVLQPGKYVLLSNTEGHYSQGQRVGFTVNPSSNLPTPTSGPSPTATPTTEPTTTLPSGSNVSPTPGPSAAPTANANTDSNELIARGIGPGEIQIDFPGEVF